MHLDNRTYTDTACYSSRDDSPSRQLVCNDLKCFAKEIEGRMSRMNLIENEITKPNPQNDDLKSSTASMHQVSIVLYYS